MPGHSEEIQHWQGLLTQYRQNARTLRKQLAVYGAGAEPLHLRNQLDATEDEIRKAKTALRKLGESPELLPGDPDEVEAFAPQTSPLPITLPPPAGPLPEIRTLQVVLTDQEALLLQYVHRGYQTVLVEKEFGGGYSGTRVLLTLPVAMDGRRAAPKVTKLGPAHQLRRERENYERYVGPSLPFCVAQVKEYYEQADQAALNYAFVGGGALGPAVSLEEYYRTRTVGEIVKTLDGLLGKELGLIWYCQTQPLNCFFADEYGRHIVGREQLEQIVTAAFLDRLPVDGDRVQLPGVAEVYPNPLKACPKVLGKMLGGQRSYVHGDLHLRNVLVNEAGVGRLIDFAKVRERHNLFDFIKLETCVRLMELARDDVIFSLNDYIRFEQTLNDAALEKGDELPDNTHLQKAYQVIRAIRDIARKYMGPQPDFKNEYLPALFLYCLAVTKYYQKDDPQPTRLAFATACVLGQSVLGLDEQRNNTRPARGNGKQSNGANKSPGPLSGPDKISTWNSVAIRDLLIAAFDDEEMTTLCFDHFRPVYEEFSNGMSKRQKAQRLLDYCVRRSQLEKLLSLIKKHNPSQYAFFAPKLRKS